MAGYESGSIVHKPQDIGPITVTFQVNAHYLVEGCGPGQGRLLLGHTPLINLAGRAALAYDGDLSLGV